MITRLHIDSMLLNNSLKLLFLDSELKMGEENVEEEVEVCLRCCTQCCTLEFKRHNSLTSFTWRVPTPGQQVAVMCQRDIWQRP